MKYIFLLLLFSWLCLPAVGKRKPVSERKRQEQIYFFHEGKKRTIFGDAKTAVYCFRRAAKADPYCDACYYELASIAAATNQIAPAIWCAQQAYNLDTTNAWYALRLAQLLALDGKLEGSQVYYEKTIALNPKLQEAYVELMLVYDKRQEYNRGVKMLTLYQQNFGVDESSLLSKQNFLYKQGKVDEAVAVVKTLVEMYPFEQRYLLLLAELYDEQKLDTLSFDALQRAKAVDSTSFEYMMALSDYYRRLSDFDSYFAVLFTIFSDKDTPFTTKLQVLEFLQQFPAVEQNNISTIDSLYSLARAKYSYKLELLYAHYLFQTQRVNQSISALKVLTARGAYDAYLLDVIKNKHSSKFFSAFALEAVAYYKAWGLFFDVLILTEAWDYLYMEAGNYAELFPDDRYRAYDLKGLARFQQKKYDEALSLWLQAEKFSAKADAAFRAKLYSSIGDVYFVQKKHSLVDKYFEKSLKLKPDNVVVLNNYAYYLSLRKAKLKKALAMSKLTIEAEPNNPTYLDTYAWILYEMGLYSESKKFFQRALVNGGNEQGVILEHYGDVLYALGEFSNAQIYWQRALEKGNDSSELREKLKRKE